MITRIEGILESIDHDRVLIAMSHGLAYEVLVSSYTAAQLGGSIGQAVSLRTLYYVEGSSQGGNLLPRLAGFLSAEDRAFFELFTTCKGIGYRKALRAMALRTDQIAAAIADRDASTLQSLPEIGKRSAETIIAALNGKVDTYIEYTGTGMRGGTGDEGSPTGPAGGIAREALQALVALGENRIQAARWVERAMDHGDDPPTTVQELITAAYRMRDEG